MGAGDAARGRRAERRSAAVARRWLYGGVAPPPRPAATPLRLEEAAGLLDRAAGLSMGRGPRGWEAATRGAVSVIAGLEAAGVDAGHPLRGEASALLIQARARVGAAPGRRVAAALAGLPEASAAALILGRALQRSAARGWPSLLALGLVVGALLAWEPTAASALSRASALPGFVAVDARPARAATRAARFAPILAQAIPSPAPPAPVEAPPRARARPRAETLAAPPPAARPEAEALATAPPEVVAAVEAPPDASERSAVAADEAALSSPAERAGGAAGGPATGVGALNAPAGGSGRIALTALADVAPMHFVDVPLPGAPDQGLLVAQTEVTEAQWEALMGLDLSVLTGHADAPAEHLTWCDALRYANALSERENFRPVYRIGEDCERGGAVRQDERADGFRLLTEDEWTRLVGPAQVRMSGRSAVYGGPSDGFGLFGLFDNAAELLWRGAPEGSAARAGVAGLCQEEGTLSAGVCRGGAAGDRRALGLGLRLARTVVTRP